MSNVTTSIATVIASILADLRVEYKGAFDLYDRAAIATTGQYIKSLEGLDADTIESKLIADLDAGLFNLASPIYTKAQTIINKIEEITMNNAIISQVTSILADEMGKLYANLDAGDITEAEVQDFHDWMYDLNEVLTEGEPVDASWISGKCISDLDSGTIDHEQDSWTDVATRIVEICEADTFTN